MDVISWKEKISFDVNVSVGNIHYSFINQVVITQSKTFFSVAIQGQGSDLVKGDRAGR